VATTKPGDRLPEPFAGAYCRDAEGTPVAPPRSVEPRATAPYVAPVGLGIRSDERLPR
jgi:hypothetical protein